MLDSKEMNLGAGFQAQEDRITSPRRLFPNFET